MSASFTDRLLNWFRARRRDLPWRRQADPYATWISEIMLQQTRVEAVLPFYERFLARFPDAQALADASEEDVLQHWAGLGYYRRARMLHAAAAQVCEEHGGLLPPSHDALLALPGIGEYTAAAIASIAFGEAVPVVDGNVKRVVARFHGEELASDDRALHRAAVGWGRELMEGLPEDDAEAAGDLNQALMELGATVCTPGRPRCEDCPIAIACEAREAGGAEGLPLPPRRKAWVDLPLAFLVAEEGGCANLRRRVDGWNPGLYEPPSLPAAPVEELRAAWRERGEAGEPGAHLGTIRHTITKHRIRAEVYRLAGSSAGELRDPSAVPLTGLARKILALLGRVEETTGGAPPVDLPRSRQG